MNVKKHHLAYWEIESCIKNNKENLLLKMLNYCSCPDCCLKVVSELGKWTIKNMTYSFSNLICESKIIEFIFKNMPNKEKVFFIESTDSSLLLFFLHNIEKCFRKFFKNNIEKASQNSLIVYVLGDIKFGKFSKVLKIIFKKAFISIKKFIFIGRDDFPFDNDKFEMLYKTKINPDYGLVYFNKPFNGYYRLYIQDNNLNCNYMIISKIDLNEVLIKYKAGGWKFSCFLICKTIKNKLNLIYMFYCKCNQYLV